MALKIAPIEEVSFVPENIDGLYLFPYAWFKCGIENECLEIEDLSFYDSLQGSISALVYETKRPHPHTIRSNGSDYDIWFSYKPGTGIVKPVITPADKITLIRSQYYSTEIVCTSVANLMQMNPNQQKTANNSIIQLFKGCGVRLIRSVWF